jgi:monovalent cation:proton antiporter-2 (CPA2) family protein
MESDNFFAQAFVYLLAAVVAVPIAKRLGLGSVLGYLLAGVAIGPFALRFIPPGGNDVMHFAEFGVVMMLFIIGLELRPALLWEMRGPILGLGGLQVTATTFTGAGVAIAAGLSWKEGFAVGMILSMSSTAIVLQSLAEKDLMKTPGGQACFSVLLFQDIAVIPILSLMPLLAAAPASSVGEPAIGLAGLPGWQKALVTLAVVAGIVFAGHFLLRHFFRFVAAARLREVFTATALLLVVGIAQLMHFIGLSPALGAFLAGVVLAESEYRHQLEADIEPFKGLLLGLFFISVGASLDLLLVAREPTLIGRIVGLLLALKFTVLLVLGRVFRIDWRENFLFAFALAQGGEFAFVLLSFAQNAGVLALAQTGPLVASVAISMALTPVLLTIHEKLVLPRFSPQTRRRGADEIDEHDNPVIIAGFGRFGHIVGRLLRANGFGVTVLDYDADWVDTLRAYGLKTFYGDASREDLLRSAGAERAQLFVCAVDEPAKSLEIIDLVRARFPRLKIFARANDRQHAYELIRRQIPHVYRETLGSSLDLSIDALVALGVEAPRAERAARIFKDYDEAAVRDMANLAPEDEAYTSRARQHIENLANILRADRETDGARPALAENQMDEEKRGENPGRD